MALGVYIDPDNIKKHCSKQYSKGVVELIHASSDLVRITLNSEEVTKVISYIIKEGFEVKY